MKIASVPDRCLAIVVGIEHYAATDDDWTLHGPAIDALRFAQWLRGRGVPAANIRLFVNFARDAADDDAPRPGSDAADLLALLTGDGVVRELPTRDALATLLDRPRRRPEAPGAAALPMADTLIVYWSGHGVVDDVETSRCFYTSDATDDSQKAVDLSATLTRLALDASLGSTFTRQLAIADACGQWTSQRDHDPKIESVSKPREPYTHETDQFVLWATEEGQFARTSPDGGMSVFTRGLMAALDVLSTGTPGTADAWPDMDTVFERVTATVVGGDQRPTLYRKPPRGGQEIVRASRYSAVVHELAEIFRTSTLPLDELRTHFRRAATTDVAMPSAASSSVYALANLVGAADIQRFSPIAAYAAGAAWICERRIAAGRDDPVGWTATLAALDTWARDYADRSGWDALRDQLRKPPDLVRHLVIDVPSNGAGIGAWLVPSHDDFAWNPGDGSARIEDEIRDVVNLAHSCCRQPVIELRVNFDALDRGLDRLEIERPLEGGLADTWTLGRDFVTYLRFRGRSDRSSTLHPPWREAWQQIKAVLQDPAGACRLRWLEDERLPANFTRAPFDTWLGLPLPAGTAASSKAMQTAIRRGAPLLIWPSTRTVDLAACRTLAERLVASPSLDDFAERWSLERSRNPDLEELHVLYDDPTRVPEIEQFSQPGQRKGP